MLYRKIIVGCLLALTLAGSAFARQNQRQQLRGWADGQRAALQQTSRFGVKATIRHSVEANNGSREADIKLRFGGNPLTRFHRPVIEHVVLNGDSLDSFEARQVQRSLTGIMTPEMGPLLFGFSFPGSTFENMRLIEEGQSVDVDEQSLVRFKFKSDPKSENRFQGPGAQRGGRPSPGIRPPRGGRSPNRQGPGPGQSPARPVEEVTFWFNQDVSELVLSSSFISLPGKRSIVVVTEFSRLNGIDVPIFRTIKGTFPMQRRLRTVTAQLDNNTAYSDYIFE